MFGRYLLEELFFQTDEVGVEDASRQQHSEVGQTARTTVWIGGRAGERGILTVQANVPTLYTVETQDERDW